jgi:uncharacterized protein YjgD (DUF1641 family)
MIKLRSSIANMTLTQNFIPNNNFIFFKLKKCASNVQAIDFYTCYKANERSQKKKKKKKKNSLLKKE